ncbi:hypothetical protein P4U99_27680 [Brevibacillus agri]|uniref:hypothetical protein n=1 Tax=Brevibacillus TaxID=55080 RepID=UPI0002A4FD4D|nr:MULTISPECIES: hypothetical protein [Brevibacillus]ELK42132.1 hypothetical protein D478_10280 [Brevibacillus agri BAB-2500]MBG9566651.1 hypothetical protein [Brevibacillus agri]MCG5254838.1 hypothetical protein [Brevibacillus agri]MED1646887.1 hypothetical protein [Brevibacillus agri]MED1657331.1 hypothetical protein [Brevibacillus agri]
MSFKKLTLATALVSTLVSPGVTAFAQSKHSIEPAVTKEKVGQLEIVEKVWETPVNYDFQVIAKENSKSIMKPYRLDYNGTDYEETKTQKYKSKSFEAEVTNRSNLTDTVTRSVSRKTFLTGKVGTSGEGKFNMGLIEAKVGFNAEVSFGTETTTTTTYTWNIPARSVTTIEYGSKAVDTKGYITKYIDGKAVKSTRVYADYSYKEYADKDPQPL